MGDRLGLESWVARWETRKASTGKQGIVPLRQVEARSTQPCQKWKWEPHLEYVGWKCWLKSQSGWGHMRQPIFGIWFYSGEVVPCLWQGVSHIPPLHVKVLGIWESDTARKRGGEQMLLCQKHDNNSQWFVFPFLFPFFPFFPFFWSFWEDFRFFEETARILSFILKKNSMILIKI